MGWQTAIPVVARVVNLVLDAWQKYKRKRDYAKRQKKRKKIAKDPARAMSKHFPGNDKLRNTSGNADKCDVGKADKADDNSSRD